MPKDTSSGYMSERSGRSVQRLEISTSQNASSEAASNAADVEAVAIENSQNQSALLAAALAAEVQSSSLSNQSVRMCDTAKLLGHALRNITEEDIVTSSTNEDDWDTINDRARDWLMNFVHSNVSQSLDLSNAIANVVADMTRVAHTVPRAAISTYESHALSWESRRSAVSDVLYVCVYTIPNSNKTHTIPKHRYSAADSLENTARSTHITSFVRALERVGVAFETIGAPASYCEDNCYDLDNTACTASSTCGVLDSNTCVYDSDVWTSNRRERYERRDREILRERIRYRATLGCVERGVKPWRTRT